MPPPTNNSAIANTRLQTFTAVWVTTRQGLPNASLGAEGKGWRTVLRGPEYPVTIAEMVTSDGLFVGAIIPPGQRLGSDELLLLETSSDLLMAAVVANHQARYTTRLLRRVQPRRTRRLERRWAVQQSFLAGSARTLVPTRWAILTVKTKAEALRKFKELEPQTQEDILGRTANLDMRARDLQQAKWEVQKDVHLKTIRKLNELEGASEVEAQLIELEASMEFAIDMLARTGLRLHPIDWLTPKERKSLARRGRKVRDIQMRQFVIDYLKQGYNKLHSPALAAAIREAGGPIKYPEAWTKIRERLGLTTDAAGRPSGYRR